MLPERCLERRQSIYGRQPFDCHDLGAVGLHRQHKTAAHCITVDDDGARAAHAMLAAHVRAGQSHVMAQTIDERGANRHVEFDRLAVDSACNLHGRVAASISAAASSVSSSAARYFALA